MIGSSQKLLMARAGVVPVAREWNLSFASYDSVSFSIAGQDTTPTETFFKADGTKMYVLGGGNDSIYQYSLSTAWDLSTASYDSVSFSVTGQDGNPQGLFFKPDGTKIYMIAGGNDSVYQYSLSTAWDLSTASYDSVRFSVTAEESNPSGVSFKTDGTKMYIVGFTNDRVRQYSLSTAWDLSTASYDSVSFSVNGQDGSPQSIFFKPDGTKMYLVGANNDRAYQYSLSSAWDLSTASYDSVFVSVVSQDTFPTGFFFKPDGTRMYITGDSSNAVYQYSLV